jgi:starch-binding outer membrane protein, SusD/RagB family
LAIARFNDAITRATAINDASLLNMARVGLARANLDKGDLAAAATAARLVTTNFVRNAEYSEQVQARENRFFDLNVRDDLISVTPAYQNLTVLLIGGTTPVADPRVPVRNIGRAGDDNVTPYWQTTKYTPAPPAPATATMPIPIASWVEAKLILAEAVGNTTEGKAAVDSVRATKNIQPLVVNPGDDWTTLILEERRRQLFAEGQRYADMLRKNLPFQTGTNRKGQVYSNLTCVPLPDVETRNNPNFGG